MLAQRRAGCRGSRWSRCRAGGDRNRDHAAYAGCARSMAPGRTKGRRRCVVAVPDAGGDGDAAKPAPSRSRRRRRQTVGRGGTRSGGRRGAQAAHCTPTMAPAMLRSGRARRRARLDAPGGGCAGDPPWAVRRSRPERGPGPPSRRTPRGPHRKIRSRCGQRSAHAASRSSTATAAHRARFEPVAADRGSAPPRPRHREQTGRAGRPPPPRDGTRTTATRRTAAMPDPAAAVRLPFRAQCRTTAFEDRESLRFPRS
jgi:hypothetical protein